jgi:hypothetical protein
LHDAHGFEALVSDPDDLLLFAEVAVGDVLEVLPQRVVDVLEGSTGTVLERWQGDTLDVPPIHMVEKWVRAETERGVHNVRVVIEVINFTFLGFLFQSWVFKFREFHVY